MLFSISAIWGRHRQLDDSLVGQLTNVVEDSGEDCISNNGNRDGDRQGPGFWKISAANTYLG